MIMGSKRTGSLITRISPAAVAFGQSIDKEIENHTEDNEPQRKELPREPEVKGQIEKRMAGKEAAALSGLGHEPDERLKTEGHEPPAEKNG
jgi:hypothetical protein